MVQSIDNALVTQFSDSVHHDAQQLMARLKPYTEIKQFSGDVWAYDGLGTVEAREANGRNMPATFDDIEHKRRKISRKRFIINLPIDASDVRGALMSPDSNYSKAIAAGMVRQYDKVIHDAAFADVLTGRDFDTTITFANDGGLTVDATAGLTYEKLLEINENFFDNDVGLDMNEKLFMTMTGKENTSLMSEIELTSGDFNRDYNIEKGSLVKATGLDLIKFAANATNPVVGVTGGVRSLMAGSDRGICLGVSKDISIKIVERNDLIETTQVQAIMEIGAVRTEGKLIQKVTTTA